MSSQGAAVSKVPLVSADGVLAALSSFGVDRDRGFLPAEPLRRLPLPRFQVWEDFADELPNILGVRLSGIRRYLETIPMLPYAELVGETEMYRAHLLLALFAHAYVWGGESPINYIPENIAVPLWRISCALNVPPVLCYFDIVLRNWRRLFADGPLTMDNIVTLNNLYGGRDESWFFLNTVEIEDVGAKAIVPLYSLNKAAHTFLEGGGVLDWEDPEIRAWVNDIAQTLRSVASAIKNMLDSLTAMREGCDPFIFFHRVRPFLAAWKSNPAVPDGVRYMGVREKWEDRASAAPAEAADGSSSGAESFPFQQFSGGSAAQSSLLPFLDICLGVDHSEHEASARSNMYLHSMRQYMIPEHREFLLHVQSFARLRALVLACEATRRADPPSSEPVLPTLDALQDAYNACLIHLTDFRTLHISIAMQFISSQQALAHSGNLVVPASLHGAAGGKGTGGTNLMEFLRPIRDEVRNNVINGAQQQN
jgi:indoleamine 2,3-dioxygenase